MNGVFYFQKFLGLLYLLKRERQNKMKIYTYEGKNLEELTLQALKELNVKEEEMLTSVKEETVGLLKKKKYTLTVVLKSDVLTFSKEYLKTVVEGMGLNVMQTLTNSTFLPDAWIDMEGVVASSKEDYVYNQVIKIWN